MTQKHLQMPSFLTNFAKETNRFNFHTMQTITIGRLPQENNVVIDDLSVSERHCRITLHDDGKYTLEDLNSASGTFVNDVRIFGTATLNPMFDTLKVGNVSLQWQNYFTPQQPSQPYVAQPQYAPRQPSAYAQQPYGQNPYRPKPDNYLVGAILSTVMCCLPFGIAAIIQANKVDSLWAMGDYAGAETAAKNARKWTWWGVGASCVGIFLYLMFLVIVSMLASLDK